MSDAGYSGTPLARKLGLKPGMRVRLLDAPEHYWSLFGDDAETLDLILLEAGDDAPADFIHAFATDADTLGAHLETARSHLAPDGLVWVSWPKKSSGMATEIGKMDVLAAGKAAGLVDVKVAAVDETWSGHKFVIPVADRPAAEG